MCRVVGDGALFRLWHDELPIANRTMAAANDLGILNIVLAMHVAGRLLLDARPNVLVIPIDLDQASVLTHIAFNVEETLRGHVGSLKQEIGKHPRLCRCPYGTQRCADSVSSDRNRVARRGRERLGDLNANVNCL